MLEGEAVRVRPLRQQEKGRHQAVGLVHHRFQVQLLWFRIHRPGGSAPQTDFIGGDYLWTVQQMTLKTIIGGGRRGEQGGVGAPMWRGALAEGDFDVV